MFRRPVIAVTVDASNDGESYLSKSAYAAAVERAGGLPLLLPYRVDAALAAQYVDLVEGILFTGGADMDPSHYGEQWHPRAVRMDPARERFEFALIAAVRRRRLPALGVCFGSQLMNVARGGSLIQFLPDQPRENAIEHRKLKDMPPARHPVELDPASELARSIGKTEISVNTYHKQAVRKLGAGLRIIATAPDGVIEAFDDPALPLFVGIQWHPERLIDEPEHRAAFELLVRKAGAR